MNPIRSYRPILWLALVAAVLLRAALPSGWMPVAQDDGIRVLLCSGSGPVEIVVPVKRAAEPSNGDHGAVPNEPCPYGLALAKVMDMPAAAPEVAMPHAGKALDGERLAAARLAILHNLRPPARGPPTLV